MPVPDSILEFDPVETRNSFSPQVEFFRGLAENFPHLSRSSFGGSDARLVSSRAGPTLGISGSHLSRVVSYFVQHERPSYDCT